MSQIASDNVYQPVSYTLDSVTQQEIRAPFDGDYWIVSNVGPAAVYLQFDLARIATRIRLEAGEQLSSLAARSADAGVRYRAGSLIFYAVGVSGAPQIILYFGR